VLRAQLTAGGYATSRGPRLKIELDDQERRALDKALVERKERLIEKQEIRRKLAQRSGRACLNYQLSHRSYENCAA
jgi:hypothetical protein